jgi:hypothetical protein
MTTMPIKRHLIRDGFLIVLLLIVASAFSIAFGTAAWSYFTSHGTGGASARVAALNPPVNVTANFPNPNQRTVDVAWSPPGEPDGIVLNGYFVTRYLGSTPSPACGTSSTNLTTSLTCQDTDVASNSYTYSVTAVFRSWSSGATSGNVTVPAPVLTSLDLAPTTPTPTAGTNLAVGVTAYDQYGELLTTYSGPQCLGFAGPIASPNGRVPNYSNFAPCAGGSIVNFSGGVGTANVTLYDAQPVNLSVTDTLTSVSGTTALTVGPNSLQSLSVVPSTPTPSAGSPFSLAITANDQYGNLDTNYTGPHCEIFTGAPIAPDGAGNTFPDAGTCATGDSSVLFSAGVAAGGAAASVTLVDATNVNLTVDDASSGHGGFTGLSVGPGALSTYTLSTPASPSAGGAFPLSLSAYDQFGNLDTNYTGQQCITFSGPSNAPDSTPPFYPAPGASCAAGSSSVHFQNGAANGSNVASIALFDEQTTTLTASNSSDTATGSLGLSVGPSSLDSYLLSPSTPTPTAGQLFTVSITALDQYQNIDTNYTGSACVTFAGPSVAPGGTGPTYPGAGTCAVGDSQMTFLSGVATGINAANVTLVVAEPVQLVATDVGSGHGGSASLTVGAAPFAGFAVIPNTTTPGAGSHFSVRLTAQDQFQNVVTSFVGAKCVTFSGPDNAPNGTAPLYPTSNACATGSSPVTFVGGFADDANASNVTLYDEESTTLTATLTPGTQNGSVPLNVKPSSTISGLSLTAITQDVTPGIACSGSIGNIVCTSWAESTSDGNVLTASLVLDDPFGNVTKNTSSSPVLVDIGVTGEGSVSPDGTGALTFAPGQSLTSAPFTLTRGLGPTQSVEMTATLDGTSQSITVTLSS